MSVSRRRFIGTSAAFSALAATPAALAATSVLGGATASPATDQIPASFRPTKRADQVMLLASQYALRMDHWHLGTEHLFFAITQESEMSGTEWMDELGIHSDEIDCIVSHVVGQANTTGRKRPSDADLIASDNLMTCLRRAEEAATELGHDSVQPEHLMLGIIDSFGTTANLLLNEMWVERGSIRHTAHASLGV